MQLEKSAASQEVVVGDIERIEYSIQNNPKLYDILSSEIYTDKIMAPIRELLCNAWDAHIAAGNTETPIAVEFNKVDADSDDVRAVFAVRDYGTGMTREQMTELYMTYGSSNKDSSDRFVGCLGLGSKSPFAFTKEFTVESFINGQKHIYVMSIEGGVPHGHAIPSCPTWEQNGLRVSFDIGENYVQAFRSALTRFCYTFNGKVVVYDDFNTSENVYQCVQTHLDDPFKVGVTFTDRAFGWDTNVKVIMGGVSYAISLGDLSPKNMPQFGVDNARWVDVYRTLSNLHGLDVYIEVPMGAVDFDVAREHCELTNKTKIAVATKFIEYFDAAEKELDKSLSEAKSDFEYSALAAKFIEQHGAELKEHRPVKEKVKKWRESVDKVRDHKGYGMVTVAAASSSGDRCVRGTLGSPFPYSLENVVSVGHRHGDYPRDTSVLLGISQGVVRFFYIPTEGDEFPKIDRAISAWVKGGRRNRAIIFGSEEAYKLYSSAGFPFTDIEDLKKSFPKKAAAPRTGNSGSSRSDIADSMVLVVSGDMDALTYGYYGYYGFDMQHATSRRIGDLPLGDKVVVVPFTRSGCVELGVDAVKLTRAVAGLSDSQAVEACSSFCSELRDRLPVVLASVGYQVVLISKSKTRIQKYLYDNGCITLEQAAERFMKEHKLSKKEASNILKVSYFGTDYNSGDYATVPTKLLSKEAAAVIASIQKLSDIVDTGYKGRVAATLWAIRYHLGGWTPKFTRLSESFFNRTTDYLEDLKEIKEAFTKVAVEMHNLFPLLNRCDFDSSGPAPNRVYRRHGDATDMYIEAMTMYWKAHKADHLKAISHN